jgi:guanosine-3',5'-bis(diphosphate) 3'-pyrophosphohydrolase
MVLREHWLRRPPGYELFFAPLEIAFTPAEFEATKFAYFASKYGHAGQTREDGSRYFDHPKAAAWIYIDELGGRDPRAIIVLLLHDISEDAYLLSPYRIKHNFSEDIALDVRAVTKIVKIKEPTEDFLARIVARGPYAILGKLCDRLHNLRTLGACSSEKRRSQVEQTEMCHAPILLPALRACGEPWARYADILEPKIRETLDAHRDTP